MTVENRVTTLRDPNVLTDAQIQAHLDEQNAEGWYLIGIDNLVNWYRFFWARTVE